MVRVSDDARDLFREFARRHGVSTAALLEAIALGLPDDDEMARTPRQREILDLARAIDSERRRRD